MVRPIRAISVPPEHVHFLLFKRITCLPAETSPFSHHFVKSDTSAGGRTFLAYVNMTSRRHNHRQIPQFHRRPKC